MATFSDSSYAAPLSTCSAVSGGLCFSPTLPVVFRQ